MTALRLLGRDVTGANDAAELTPHEQDVLLLSRYFARELTEEEATAAEARMVDDERFYTLAEPMMVMRRLPRALRPAKTSVVTNWVKLTAATAVLVLGLGTVGVFGWFYAINYAIVSIYAPDLFKGSPTSADREAEEAAHLPAYFHKARQTIGADDVVASGPDTMIVRLSNGTVVRLHPGSRFRSEGPPWPIKSKDLRIELLSGAADVAMPYQEMWPFFDNLKSPAGQMELHGGSYRLRCSNGCRELLFVIDRGLVPAPAAVVPKGVPFVHLTGGDSVLFTPGKMEQLSNVIGKPYIRR